MLKQLGRVSPYQILLATSTLGNLNFLSCYVCVPKNDHEGTIVAINNTDELLKTVAPAYRKSMNSKHGLHFPNWKCGPHKERKIFT